LQKAATLSHLHPQPSTARQPLATYLLTQLFLYIFLLTFLIKNLFIYLKNEEFDYVYLVPGSSYGKNNYEYYIEHSYCTYQDYDKYLVSNIKLLIYYKKLGFKVSKKLYDLDKCNDSEYHLFHVLYKKL